MVGTLCAEKIPLSPNKVNRTPRSSTSNLLGNRKILGYLADSRFSCVA
jgi:hypothetical protein